MFGFPCRCVERGCYSCGVSLDTHLETQAVIKKPETAHARLCRRAYVFAQIKACAHTTTHRKSAHPPGQRANTRRSKSKSYGQSVSSLTPEERRVRLLGESVSRRTLATRDGSKSEVDAPCLCVWETQSRT